MFPDLAPSRLTAIQIAVGFGGGEDRAAALLELSHHAELLLSVPPMFCLVYAEPCPECPSACPRRVCQCGYERPLTDRFFIVPSEALPSMKGRGFVVPRVIGFTPLELIRIRDAAHRADAAEQELRDRGYIKDVVDYSARRYTDDATVNVAFTKALTRTSHDLGFALAELVANSFLGWSAEPVDESD